MRNRRRSRYDISQMFVLTGSRQSACVADAVEPRREHHRQGEIRVGLGSGVRSSSRVPDPRRSGTRIIGERLRMLHATFTGASKPGHQPLVAVHQRVRHRRHRPRVRSSPPM
jgi:hypothetical protein